MQQWLALDKALLSPEYLIHDFSASRVVKTYDKHIDMGLLVAVYYNICK